MHHLSIIEVSPSAKGDVFGGHHRFLGDLDADAIGVPLNGQFDAVFTREQEWLDRIPPDSDEILDQAGYPLPYELAEEGIHIGNGLENGDHLPILDSAPPAADDDDPLAEAIMWGFCAHVSPVTEGDCSGRGRNRAREGKDHRVHGL